MKRIIATLLSVLMVFGTVSISALAEEEAAADETVTATEEAEAVELPTATVTELDVHEEDIDLTYALNFSADAATEEQLAAYGDWYADFVFTINKDAVFNANDEQNGYLAGRYEAYSDGAWIKVPFEDMPITADESVKIMETAAEMAGQPGLKYTYAEVYEVVKDFGCGVHYSDEFLLANPDLETTLELRIYNPENEEESYAIGKVYEFKVKAPATEENVVVQGTKVTGNAVEIHEVNTDEATEGTTSVTINTNDFVDESTPAEEAVVDTIKIPAAAIDTVKELGADATLNITLANGEEEDVEVSINKAALDAISSAAGDASASSLTLKVEKTEDLETEQDNTVSNLDNGVVYKVSLETEDGTSLYAPADAADARNIEIKIYYTKSPTGKVKVYVKHLKDDGTLEDVDFSYDNNIVTMNLAHFSEYVIYEKRVSSGLSSVGGSATPAKYTVQFDTDGGSAVASQRVEKNDKVSEPAAPTKEGYTFEGWYTDNSFTTAYDFETAVTKAFTLYAKWAEGAKADEEPKDDADVLFADVAEADWFYGDVKYVSDNKLMNGVTDTEFAPNGLLTRAMLVTILYRNEGEPAVNRSIPFADIDLGAYYASAVIWAQQNGIVNGVTETEFAPDENITREQIAAIMFRYAISKGLEAVTLEENLTAFADEAEITEYAISAMNWAVGSGLMKGKTESTLNPKDNTTRAEVAAVIRRYIEGNAQN